MFAQAVNQGIQSAKARDIEPKLEKARSELIASGEIEQPGFGKIVRGATGVSGKVNVEQQLAVQQTISAVGRRDQRKCRESLRRPARFRSSERRDGKCVDGSARGKQKDPGSARDNQREVGQARAEPATTFDAASWWRQQVPSMSNSCNVNDVIL